MTGVTCRCDVWEPTMPSNMALTSLVVCADAKAVQVLSRILREMGIRSEHCGDPQQAISRFKTDRFDALLVDCANEAAARQVVAAAKSSATNKNSLVMAIADTTNNVREIIAEGVSFVLYKPLSADRVSNSLRAARSLLPNERRRKPRVPLYGAVSIAYGTSENVPANLVDLSQEGLAIRAERALAPSAKVYFEFKLPNHGSSTVRLSGEVVWTDFTGRIGLSFAKVPQSSRQLLDSWLKGNLHRQTDAGAVPAAASEQVRGPLFSLVGAGLDPAGNRRGQSRLSCRMGAEVYALGSKVPQHCNLIDISPGGCYVEVISPFPPGTPIDIIVRTENIKTRLKGKVRSAHMGYGMGVEFVLNGPDDKAQVKKLLEAQAAQSQITVEPIEQIERE
jgi:CheY-like chemotaxis protein